MNRAILSLVVLMFGLVGCGGVSEPPSPPVRMGEIVNDNGIEMSISRVSTTPAYVLVTGGEAQWRSGSNHFIVITVKISNKSDDAFLQTGAGTLHAQVNGKEYKFEPETTFGEYWLDSGENINPLSDGGGRAVFQISSSISLDSLQYQFPESSHRSLLVE